MPKESNKIKEDEEFGKIFFEWQVDKYPQHKRTKNWYLLMSCLVLALIIYSIFTANFLFALIIILVTFIIFLRDYSRFSKLNFRITEEGIILGGQFFPYNRIKKFYIIYDPPQVKKLFFKFKDFSPDLSVPLEDTDPLAIHEKLSEYVDEDVKKENQSLDDQLETILKL